MSSERGAYGIPLAALVVGLMLALYPMVWSGFAQTPTESRDGRLVHFLLEHASTALAPGGDSPSLWDPPVFHPASNVGAYTDLMAGQVPFYGVWRLLGMSPDAAFQAWITISFVLNFVLFFWMLRDCLDVGTIAASMGAFLFAFGSRSIASLMHPQMMARVWVVLALWALWKTLRQVEAGEHGWRAQIWVPVFFLALVLQAWSAFYHLFFLLLFISLTTLVAVVTPSGRRRLAQLSRSRGAIVVASTIVSAIFILPLVVHYGEALSEVGGRNWTGIVRRLPRWHSWILMGPGSLLYGWLQRPGGPLELGRFMSSEVHSNGVGLVTLALAAGGLYLGRARAAVRTLVGVTLLAVLATSVLPNGFTVWRGLFHLVPGASALRAVARIGIHLAIPLGVGLALAFEALAGKRRWAWMLVLALIVAAEQARRVRSFDVERMRSMTAEIESQVDEGCESFFVSSLGRRRDPYLPENAMWAALSTGVPTVNGRYGNYPSRYPRLLVAAHRREPGAESRAAIEAELDAWLETGSRDVADTCWIETSVEGGLRTARRLN